MKSTGIMLKKMIKSNYKVMLKENFMVLGAIQIILIEWKRYEV